MRSNGEETVWASEFGESEKGCGYETLTWARKLTTFLRAADRIQNKAKLKPFELVDPRNTGLRSILQNAEYAVDAGADVVDRDAEDDEGPTGSASDSE